MRTYDDSVHGRKNDRAAAIIVIAITAIVFLMIVAFNIVVSHG